MMFDFEEANKMLEDSKMVEADGLTSLILPSVDSAMQDIKKGINLEPLIEQANTLVINNDQDARQAVSMALQARKLATALDNSRKEITKPQLDFQKAVNKLVKDYEKKLKDIEESLTCRLNDWIKVDDQDALTPIEKIEVEDGSMKRTLSWEFDVEDSKEIPFKYMMPDIKEIEKAIKAGIREIPGIKIYEKQELTLRVKN